MRAPTYCFGSSTNTRDDPNEDLCPILNLTRAGSLSFARLIERTYSFLMRIHSSTTTITNTSSSSSHIWEALLESPNAMGQNLPVLHLKNYSLTDLKMATGNFKSDAVIGVGLYSVVFKGWVDPETLAPSMDGIGMAVAVKKFTSQSYDRKKIVSELSCLRRLPHPNVIKMLGYCLEGKNRLFVYEFMRKGRLDKHLFNKTSSVAPICWDARLKIAIGAARGLTFMHTSEKQVVHSHFRISSILLDGSYNPKIAQFNFVTTTHENDTETVASGTPGYHERRQTSVLIDVYSFGVVLLEIITGLPAFDLRRPEGEKSLVVWAKPLLSDRMNLRTIMDARLNGQYSKDAAFKAAQLTLKCLGDDPQTRPPTMKEVVDALERIQRM